jgi:nicotinamide riboside transporter PnuC
MKAANWTCILVSVIYLTVSFCVIYLFGSKVKVSFLDSLNDLKSWESVVCRVSYLIIVACHIPYVYFACKEAALVIVDEI